MREMEKLRDWINPEHLEEERIRAYRDSFASHPGKLVVLSHFLRGSIADRLGRFLSGEAEFQALHGLYSVPDGSVAEDQWRAAPSEDRFFRYGKLLGIAPSFQLSPNALTYLRFRKAFQESPLRTYFEAISGLDLGPSDDFGAHRMIRGDFLGPHDDDNRNRRLALVIYLSSEWDPRFGGALYVTDPDGTDTRIEAEYNSVVAFDVLAGTTHFVGRITAEADDRARLTLGGWYHKLEGSPPVE